MNEEIYEVLLSDYENFLRTIKPNYRKIITDKTEDDNEIISIYSTKTNKLLTKRIKNKNSEKYYIFNTPEADESIEPVPRIQLHLETPDEVKNFFEIINKIQKESKHE